MARRADPGRFGALRSSSTGCREDTGTLLEDCLGLGASGRPAHERRVGHPVHVRRWLRPQGEAWPRQAGRHPRLLRSPGLCAQRAGAGCAPRHARTRHRRSGGKRSVSTLRTTASGPPSTIAVGKKTARYTAARLECVLGDKVLAEITTADVESQLDRLLEVALARPGTAPGSVLGHLLARRPARSGSREPCERHAEAPRDGPAACLPIAG